MFAFAWVVGLLLFSEGVTSDDESSLLRNKRAVGTKRKCVGLDCISGHVLGRIKRGSGSCKKHGAPRKLAFGLL